MIKTPPTPPWKKKKKKAGKSKKKMTEAQIAEARRRAAEAGRPYPNLVDNMAVLRDPRFS